MSQPLLYLVKREPPAHRGGEADALNAVRGLNAISAEVHCERVTATRFHEPEPLALSHATELGLADLSALIHAGKRTRSYAGWFAPAGRAARADGEVRGLSLLQRPGRAALCRPIGQPRPQARQARAEDLV